jgi:hypothetical protein
MSSHGHTLKILQFVLSFRMASTVHAAFGARVLLDSLVTRIAKAPCPSEALCRAENFSWYTYVAFLSVSISLNLNCFQIFELQGWTDNHP